MTTDIHICAECTHFLPAEGDPGHTFARCQAKFELNLVTGEKTYIYCQARRNNATCPNFEKFEVNYG